MEYLFGFVVIIILIAKCRQEYSHRRNGIIKFFGNNSELVFRDPIETCTLCCLRHRCHLNPAGVVLLYLQSLLLLL